MGEEHIKELNEILSKIRKMYAIIEQSDLANKELEELRVHATKLNKLNRKDKVNEALDFINERNKELEILSELSQEICNCPLENLRLKVAQIKASLSKYEEALENYYSLTESYEILKSAGVFEDPEYTQDRSNLLKDIDTTHKILNSGRSRLNAILAEEKV